MVNDILLKTENLTMSFGGFNAVDGVDLAVERGSVHALIGPNGAGKTTCFNLLTKFLSPTSGRIYHDGRDVTRMEPAEMAQRNLIRSFQISSIFATMTVLENVLVALQRRHGGSFVFWRRSRNLRQLEQEAMGLLELVGLEDQAREPACSLSYGRKRALELATTLAMDPSLMLLDEPTSGMGHEDVERTAELISRAAEGRTVLIVEHNLPVVAKLADRITVLCRGQVLAEGDYETVSNDPTVIKAYVGEDHDEH
nr:ABC transporter ATP-binding protein [Marinobacter sp. F3R11]